MYAIWKVSYSAQAVDVSEDDPVGSKTDDVSPFLSRVAVGSGQAFGKRLAKG